MGQFIAACPPLPLTALFFLPSSLPPCMQSTRKFKLIRCGHRALEIPARNVCPWLGVWCVLSKCRMHSGVTHGERFGKKRARFFVQTPRATNAFPVVSAGVRGCTSVSTHKNWTHSDSESPDRWGWTVTRSHRKPTFLTVRQYLLIFIFW